MKMAICETRFVKVVFLKLDLWKCPYPQNVTQKTIKKLHLDQFTSADGCMSHIVIDKLTPLHEQ